MLCRNKAIVVGLLGLDYKKKHVHVGLSGFDFEKKNVELKWCGR